MIQKIKVREVNFMNSIYGDHLPKLNQIMDNLMNRISDLRSSMERTHGMDPVEHCLCRIKDEESMREKCRRNNLEETTENALFVIHDAIGLRVVCAFVDDVYTIRDHLVSFPDIEIIEEKDYIKKAKPNGYRSLHLILRVDGTYYA